ncbi:hypothetical protein imdm_1843 [gamma proteobacterium IMCC2047]|nr:hypothetical protein imdm_1843 [gamma proteobacterium IMCC2047]
MAARVVARYGKGRDAEQVSVQIDPVGGEGFVIEVSPYPVNDIPKEWHV